MVKITGDRAHAAHLRQLSGPEMIDEVGKALFAGGSIIEIEAELSITRGSVSGKHHVPSKPGEPPRRDTGHLDTNIETARVEPLKVTVTSNAEYAAALEFGTSRMAARPYMRPATEKKREEVQRLVGQAVSTVVRRGTRG